MDGLEQTHEPDVAIVVEDWAQARLAALRATAEDLVGQFWAQAALERGRRPRKEWGRLGVRVRLQRAPRSQPGAFSIEWFVCRWSNRQGGGKVHTAYIRRGAELRYSRAAFGGLAQPWEIDLADAMEHRFVPIRRLVQSLSALRVQLRQHLRLEQRLAGIGAEEGA
jgi:hypothetical protein